MSWMRDDPIERCPACSRKMTKKVLFTSFYHECDACLEDEKIRKHFNEMNKKEPKIGVDWATPVEDTVPDWNSKHGGYPTPSTYGRHSNPNPQAQTLPRQPPPLNNPNLYAPYGQASNGQPHVYQVPAQQNPSVARGNIIPRPKLPYPVQDIKQCQQGCGYQLGYTQCRCFSIMKNLKQLLGNAAPSDKWVAVLQAGDLISTSTDDWQILQDGVYEITFNAIRKMP